MKRNRKTATRLQIVQWARFQNVEIALEGSTLFTGVNGSGKSTILDAISYLLTGNTQFNKAAKDRDRTVTGYVRGDTKSNGASRFLRSGAVISYILMEFYSPQSEEYLTVGVCIESPAENAHTSSWFVLDNTRLDQVEVCRVTGRTLEVMPRSNVYVKDRKVPLSIYMNREKGIPQLQRALGLRVDPDKYRSKLVKMMSFNPENNVDAFISQCVLEPGKIEGLANLRFHKERLEQLQAFYAALEKQKQVLEEIETCAREYETRKHALDLRRLMLPWQQLQEARASQEALQEQESSVRSSLDLAKQDLDEIRQRQQLAQDQLNEARNSAQFQEVRRLQESLERQKELNEEKIKPAARQKKRLQDLSQWISQLLEQGRNYLDLNKEQRDLLRGLDLSGLDPSRKMEALKKLEKMVNWQLDTFRNQKSQKEQELSGLRQELNEIQQQIDRLERSQLLIPAAVEKERAILQKELEKKNLPGKVRCFCELVASLEDESWRPALEALLGPSRFALIVSADQVQPALKIIEQKKLNRLRLVLTSRLPDDSPKAGSAAALLRIENRDASRYACYLLNSIALCSGLQELEQHPRGGLTKSGMLARGYSVRRLDTDNTDYVLGQDSIRYALEKARRQEEETRNRLESVRRDVRRIENQMHLFTGPSLRCEDYDFRAPEEFARLNQELKDISIRLHQIHEDQSFMALLDEMDKAEKLVRELSRQADEAGQQVYAGTYQLDEIRRQTKQLQASIPVLEKEYRAQAAAQPSLEEEMLSEYEKLRAEKQSPIVVKEARIRELENKVQSTQASLLDLQARYVSQAAGQTGLKQLSLGIGCLPEYRQELQNLENVEMEKVRVDLDREKQTLETALMHDFVSALSEQISAARREIDLINDELKKLPFGSDTYRFVMKEKPDRAPFFAILRKLENFLGNPDLYMNSLRSDEEMEMNIREYVSLILEEEDDDEYTDYRRYFTYDMRIISRKGDEEITADLSRKHGSASNGEKQTPYLIILAAALNQCYPQDACCERLALIDEAFSALSRERIEQMVKFLEENSFQVIYAAPPEKIGSIGRYIDSTVSLVETGRYSRAVEGLVKQDEIDA